MAEDKALCCASGVLPLRDVGARELRMACCGRLRSSEPLSEVPPVDRRGTDKAGANGIVLEPPVSLCSSMYSDWKEWSLPASWALNVRIRRLLPPHPRRSKNTWNSEGPCPQHIPESPGLPGKNAKKNRPQRSAIREASVRFANAQAAEAAKEACDAGQAGRGALAGLGVVCIYIYTYIYIYICG